ncbi:cytochrome P450 [Scenedesmus sp. NREL 46B-D3]|nr:cytochrome P450 [Scenedesmus sp. NREL 46B-D3]
MLERFRKYGPVFKFKLTTYEMTTVVDYEAVRSLLQLGDSKVMTGWNPPALYAMLGEDARRNLEDPAARAFSRKLMAPGFSKEALRGYLGKIEAICVKQLEAWAAAGKPVDLRAEGKALSFEFSTQLLVDFDVPEEEKAAIKRKLDLLFQGMFAPPTQLPGSRFSKGIAAKAELQQDIIRIIKEGKAAKQQQQQQQQGGEQSSVFSYMLEARRQTQTMDGNLSEQQMADAGIGLIIAGNDTSGLGISALLAILPQFPGVLHRLRQEQREVMAKFGPELSINVLEAMPYADAVVREVLRVAPPSAQVMRQTLLDMEVLGKFVPKGSRLLLSTLMGQVLTDPKLNPNLGPQQLETLDNSWYSINADTLKQEFKPERWLVQQQQQQQQHSSSSSSSSGNSSRPSQLLTFSVGPHVCLGLSLFMHEAKVLLALLARGYSLDAVNSDELLLSATMVTQLTSDTQIKFGKVQQPAEVPVAAR